MVAHQWAIANVHFADFVMSMVCGALLCWPCQHCSVTQQHAVRGVPEPQQAPTHCASCLLLLCLLLGPSRWVTGTIDVCVGGWLCSVCFDVWTVQCIDMMESV
jgi:hypothetical protein